jgi:DNA topoisomerase-1
VLGVDPADGATVLANNGRYGPYVQKGEEFRSLDNEERLFTVTLDEALALLAAPRTFRRSRAGGAAQGPLREFGADPVSGKNVIARDGRFGTYVSDGDTHASIGKGDRVDTMTPERAFELLAARREALALKGEAPAKGRATAKTAGARKTPARTAPARTSPAKKAPAKKAPAKKRPN